jgi:hypothetical protein
MWLQRCHRIHPPLAGDVGINSNEGLRINESFEPGEAFQFDSNPIP